MTRFKTIETVSDQFLEVAFQSQVLKPSPDYDGSASKWLKRRIELTHAGKTRRANTITELMEAIAALGIAPQDYAAREPITLARALSYLEGGPRAIYSHPLFEELLSNYNLSIVDYMPRWEPPLLVWYILDPLDRLKPLRERKITVL